MNKSESTSMTSLEFSRLATRMASADKFIDNVQHPDLAPIVRAILNKVISPNMIWPFWLEPDA